MRDSKKTALIVLCLILAAMVTMCLTFVAGIGGYYVHALSSAHFEMELKISRNTDENCQDILNEFGLSHISAEEIKAAEITASGRGESVLLVRCTADVKNMGVQMAEAYDGKYRDVQLWEASGKVSTVVEMRQLWRITGQGIRVTAYEITSGVTEGEYIISVLLPINKFAYVKQNGKFTYGFPDGVAKLSK